MARAQRVCSSTMDSCQGLKLLKYRRKALPGKRLVLLALGVIVFLASGFQLRGKDIESNAFVASQPYLSRHLRRSLAVAAEGKDDKIFVVTQAPSVEGSEEAADGGAPVEKKEEGGKRLRQFLALEALDPDIDPGDQWAKDDRADGTTAEEQRKKLTAIVTGVISVLFGGGYMVATFFMDTREFEGETALSAQDVAILQQTKR
eukprot:TRINITY_DN96552_c0_g1_i1.p1 TRINITY_DN96552_c0_g1~~TRINITY_DN96552_c0_g1_i1.p1  ORF type:complete len:203 (-),score=38.78 TRINITY_DN96552_c0_g1_i1:55-663(-)